VKPVKINVWQKAQATAQKPQQKSLQYAEYAPTCPHTPIYAEETLKSAQEAASAARPIILAPLFL